MAVEIEIGYEGNLRCRAVHGPSGEKLATDAPVDNNGRGETFSPTDLMATALGSCMATIMGIVAERKGINLQGMTVRVEKQMSEDLPRRIARLPVEIRMPLAEDSGYKDLMVNSALTCPVHQSLRADIEVPIDWRWEGEGD